MNKNGNCCVRNNHMESLLEKLNDYRQNEQFTDVALICGDSTRIVAHKNVLAAASPYFMCMFSGHFPEGSQKEIHINDMDASCLQAAVNFIYSGNLDIDQMNAQQLLVTAEYLQLQEMCNLCAEYMVHHLDAENCLSFKHFAEKHNNFVLLNAANKYLVTHFKEIVQGDEFIEMSFDELKNILCNDKLFVHSDDVVLCGLARWAEYKREERLNVLGDLLCFIHPTCVSADVVRSIELLQHNINDSCQHWCDQVQKCSNNMEWRIFVLDKMGREPQLQSYDMSFERITSLRPLPRAGFAVSLAAYKNILYVQGGSRGRSTRDSYYYNIYRDQWHELSALLIERSHHRSVVVGNEYLYAIGGNSLDGVTSTMECLNLITNSSTFSKNMLTPRSSLGAVTYDNVIYVMGGETQHRTLHTAERYDPRIGVWHELPVMREVKSYCSSTVLDASIYCCEGLGNCMERFDIRANRWDVVDLWEEHEFYEIFTVDNKLYSIFGEGISHYDTETNSWMNMYKFPTSHEWDTAVGMQTLNYYFF